jgi:hypothetical protein
VKACLQDARHPILLPSPDELKGVSRFFSVELVLASASARAH